MKKSKFDIEKISKDAINPALMLVGMYAGNKIGIQIDKYVNRNSTKGTEGIFGIDLNNIVSPLVLGIGGLTLHQFLKDPKFKPIGYGIAAAGGFRLIKNVWNKDILSGIDDDDEEYIEIPTEVINALPEDDDDIDDELEQVDNEFSGIAKRNVGTVGDDYEDDDDYEDFEVE